MLCSKHEIYFLEKKLHFAVKRQAYNLEIWMIKERKMENQRKMLGCWGDASGEENPGKTGVLTASPASDFCSTVIFQLL